MFLLSFLYSYAKTIYNRFTRHYSIITTVNNVLALRQGLRA